MLVDKILHLRSNLVVPKNRSKRKNGANSKMETSETSETRQLQGERSKLQNWKERNCWCHQQLDHLCKDDASSSIGGGLWIKLKIDFRSYKRVNGRSERFKVSKSIYSPSATTFDFIAKPLTPTCQAQIDRKENENDGLPSSALG